MNLENIPDQKKRVTGGVGKMQKRTWTKDSFITGWTQNLQLITNM